MTNYEIKSWTNVWNLIAETRPDNTRIRTYVWGSDLSGSMQGAGGVGGLFEISYYGSSTTNCFPAYDGNGNIMALVNAADGTLAANYDYAAFGEPIRITGVMARNNPFRFSTKYADDESDLLYYGYRYYKPSTGTWPSRDPINELGFKLISYMNNRFNRGEELNLYGFVYNDTTDRYDVNGLMGPIVPVAAALAAALYICVHPDYVAAHQNYGDSGDKFKHCWVSCRISKKCGASVAQLAGLSKEVQDEVYKDLEEMLKKDLNGDGNVGGDGFDTKDLFANQQCIGWESYIGPAGGWVGALCRESCEKCCRRKVGY